MSKSGLEGGVPSSYVEKAQFDVLQTSYGNFAAAILLEVLDTDSAAPMDILTIGDDWFQLVNTYTAPRNASEELLAQSTGATQFSDAWPIKRRKPGMQTTHILSEIAAGVVAGSLDARILEKIAVLDATSDIPPHNEAELLTPQDTPWGINGILQGTGTLVYHIRSGFHRQGVIDIPSRPEDNVTSRVFYPKDRKDL